MPKRRGVFRTKLKIAGKTHYAKRDKKGRFVDIQSLERTVPCDLKKRTRKKVKPGYGFRGDTKQSK